MASINGYWFIIIGLIVTTVSLFNDDLEIFIYIGIIFLLYGVGKCGLRFLKKEKKTKAQKEQKPSQEQATQHHPQQNNHQHKQIYFCKNCGKRLTIHDNFCPHCGIRLK
ncbi:MAG: zinc-ribbon domain-containing protein [Nanobdellota archaeon]